MNPARSLGPAFMSWTWTAQWIYLLGPIVGAVIGAYVYRWLRDASQRTATTPSLEPAALEHAAEENENA